MFWLGFRLPFRVLVDENKRCMILSLWIDTCREFQCNDGKCIPFERTNDGYVDCDGPFGEDERSMCLNYFIPQTQLNKHSVILNLNLRVIS